MAHYSVKRRVLVDGASPTDRMWPLAAVYVLGNEGDAYDGDIVTISRLSSRDACVELIRNAFQLDPGNPANATRMLALASDVASKLPVYALDYPRDYSRLPAVRDAILEHVGQDL